MLLSSDMQVARPKPVFNADFLFVECRDSKPRILHITAYGTPEWAEGRFAATGTGDGAKMG